VKVRKSICLLAIFIGLHSNLSFAQPHKNSDPVSMNASLDLTVSQKARLIARANRGDNEAAARLGMYFDFVAGHHPAAYFWFRKAALNGHVKSQFNLGVRSLGKKTFQSCNEARYWFEMAKKNGKESAQKELSRMPNCNKYDSDVEGSKEDTGLDPAAAQGVAKRTRADA
jgi:TPR repeat protein